MRASLGIVAAVVTAVFIASCGGGGAVEGAGVAPVPDVTSMEAQALRARGERHPELLATPVSLVNTSVQGGQELRAIGATDDGGYTVAWYSATPSTLAMQHYDAGGTRDGGETLIASSPSQANSQSALAVLGDGSVVVVFTASAPTPENPGGIGIFLQRYDADGTSLIGPTRVSSQVGSGGRGNVLGLQQVAVLADGGFVAGWTLGSYSLFGSTYSLWLQRFDAQAQPVGTLVAAGTYKELRYELQPDPLGGFALEAWWYQITPYTTEALHSIVHYDAAMQTGPEPAVPVPAGAVVSRELADGTFLGVFDTGEGSFSAQRYSASGVRLGDPFAIQIVAPPYRTASFQIAALTEPGFALAWSGLGAAGDSDVFTQAFVPSEHERVKACRDAAKAQGLKGKERRAFVENCAG